MASVLIVEPPSDFVDQMGVLLGADADVVLSTVGTLEEAELVVAETPPHVVLVGPGIVGERALAFAQSIAVAGKCTAVVLIAPELTTELLRSALHAGVSDAVAADDKATEIHAAVRRAITTAEGARLTTPASVEEPEESGLARVISIFGTKGGVGKTVLATNLGVALSKMMGKRTILVDLDLQFGDCAIMLGLKPARTILDAVKALDRLDADMLGSMLVEHPSGLRVLLAPVQPEDAESVTTTRINHIVSLLREMADYVVIDTAATLDETVLAALDRSDSVCAVTMMDVASIKNTKISLQKLRQLGYQNGLMRVILNRADSKVWLEPGQVEQAISSKIWVQVPSDRVVPRSVNKGVPVVLEAPKSEVARSILSIAKKMVEEEEATDHVA